MQGGKAGWEAWGQGQQLQRRLMSVQLELGRGDSSQRIGSVVFMNHSMKAPLPLPGSPACGVILL